MNHSKQFRDRVDELFPDRIAAVKEIKEFGGSIG
jgi:predicted metal-dependent hydrolase